MTKHNITTAEDKPTNITLFICEDDEIIEKDGDFLFKLDEKTVIKLDIVGTDGLYEKLLVAGKDAIRHNLSGGRFPLVEVHIYQYKNKFFIQYVIEDLAVDLANNTVRFVDELLGE